MHISGKCLYGKVRYESEAESVFMGKCYCLDCGNESGIDHIATIAVPDAAFKFEGAMFEYAKTSDDGHRLTK